MTTDILRLSDLQTVWSGPAYSAAQVTRKAAATGGSLFFMEADFDANGNLIRTSDIGSGRMDCYGVNTAGAAFVVALHKASGSPANNDNLGHFAYRGKDSNNVNDNTWAYMLASIKDVTATTACSALSLAAMRNVDCTGGNGQPNWGIVIDGSGPTGQVTMPSGAVIVESGNTSKSAAAGPTTTYSNTANSRNLIVGVADNFNGVVNATGGAGLNLQSSGTTGISISTVKNNLLIPTQLQSEVSASKTSNYSVLTTDAGTRFDNNTAAGEVDFTLPTSPSTNCRYVFNVVVGQVLKVIAGGTNKINIGGTLSAAGGNAASSQPGAALEIFWSGGLSAWVAKSATGTGGSSGAGGWTVT